MAESGNWLQGVKSRAGCSGSVDLLHQVTIQLRPMQTQWAHSTITRGECQPPRSQGIACSGGALDSAFRCGLPLMWRGVSWRGENTSLTPASRECSRLTPFCQVLRLRWSRLAMRAAAGAVRLNFVGRISLEYLFGDQQGVADLLALKTGASRETRTLTLLPTADFESAASTDSAIEAQWRRSIGRRRSRVNRLAWPEGRLWAKLCAPFRPA